MQQRLSSDHVLDHLRSMIGTGELTPGGRLPPERILAERMQVNRGTLRKALGHLEMEGVITRHVGRGTFIGHAPAAAAVLARRASPMELMEARSAIEPVIAREAALRARKEHIIRLRLCSERGDDADEFEPFEQWDVAFHRTLAEATRNPIFIMVMEVMREMRTQEEWERLKRSSFGPELRETYRAQHRAVLCAVEGRDPAAAAEAMFAHTQTVRSALARVAWRQQPADRPAAADAARLAG